MTPVRSLREFGAPIRWRAPIASSGRRLRHRYDVLGLGLRKDLPIALSLFGRYDLAVVPRRSCAGRRTRVKKPAFRVTLGAFPRTMRKRADSALKEKVPRGEGLKVVAGVGFEPTAFRL
jgi:hypothetical protein